MKNKHFYINQGEIERFIENSKPTFKYYRICTMSMNSDNDKKLSKQKHQEKKTPPLLIWFAEKILVELLKLEQSQLCKETRHSYKRTKANKYLHVLQRPNGLSTTVDKEQ